MKDLKYINNDKAHVEELKKGSVIAFKFLFDKYGNRLYAFALGYLKSHEEAEGVVQDVFAKIWEKRADLKPECSFKSYIFTIAFNLIKKAFEKRKKGRNYINSKEESETIDISTSNQISYNFLMDQVLKLVEKMPERRREVFVKSRFEGLSGKDIAREMFISPKTVENQITSALNYLRSNMLTRSY